MAAIDDVNRQFINPGDANTLYEGGDSPRKVFDLRGMVKYITWDLLRVQRPKDRATGSVSVGWGLRDSVTRQHYIAEQNNLMLKALCEASGIEIPEP